MNTFPHVWNVCFQGKLRVRILSKLLLGSAKTVLAVGNVLVLAATVTQRGVSLQLPPSGQSPDSSSVNQVTMLIAQGNDFAQKYFDNRKALALYSEALSLESTNGEILWRMSRSYVDIAEHLPTSTDEEKNRQLQTYEKALEFANKSIEVTPKSSMAYTRRAIALSRLSLFKGLWESIGLMKETRTDLEKAVALDSTNHLAYYMLGMTHMKVIERPWIFRWPLGLGWGDRETAIHLYEKAVELKMDFVSYRLACAKAYADEGEYEEARAHLSLIPYLLTQDEDDGQYRREAKELFDRIADEEE